MPTYRRLKAFATADRSIVATMGRCAALDEYRVRLHVDGVLVPNADYFTSDANDAWLSARAMVRNAKARREAQALADAAEATAKFSQAIREAQAARKAQAAHRAALKERADDWGSYLRTGGGRTRVLTIADFTPAHFALGALMDGFDGPLDAPDALPAGSTVGARTTTDPVPSMAYRAR